MIVALTVLAVSIRLATIAACAAESAAPISVDQKSRLKEAGYSELSGPDAVRFLVGNSVLIRKVDDSGTDYKQAEYNRIYYFLDDQTIYDCGMAPEADCLVGSWSVKDDKICDIISCMPFAIFKSPKPDDSGPDSGKLGVYLLYNYYAHDILKGDRTGSPRFDFRISANPIQLSRAELHNEFKQAAKHRGDRDTKIHVSGARAISLLVGNTFVSDHEAALSTGQPTKSCSRHGEYYSPDGRLISVTCVQSPHIWTIRISHWKISSGLLCRDGPGEDSGRFDCARAELTAIPAPHGEGESDKMLVLEREGSLLDGGLTGYAGNVFNFKFEGHTSFDKTESR
jgi:hypothetical protein